MTKVTLNNVGSLIDATTAATTINGNFDTIETAFDNTLSRDGTAPNTMQASIDMNSNQILNLPAPATQNSPARLIDLENAAIGDFTVFIPDLAANNTWTGTNTFNPIAGLNHSIVVNQTGTGVAPALAPFILGNFGYTTYTIEDHIDASGVGGVVSGMIVQTNTSGASAKGFHGAGTFLANINGAIPTDGTFGGVQGLSSLAQSLYPMGGTGTTAGLAKGAIYGFGVIAIAYGPGPVGTWPGATNILNLTGGEINVGAKAGSSLSYKSAIQIASFGDDAVQGTLYDAALSISAQGGIGWRHGILFSRANAADPMNAAGTLIGCLDADTVAHGIDFSVYSFSSDAIKTPGFLVDGLGITTVKSLRVSGSVSGSTLVTAGVTTPVNTVTLPGGNTALAGIAVQQVWTGQQLFQDTTFVLLPAVGVGTATFKYPDTANNIVITFPTSADTLVGKATTDTFTNKTFDTAGTGNSFSINGLAATANTGTGAVVRAIGPTFTGTVTLATPFTLGATSVTSTGTQLNYLNAATGTTGTTSTNVVFSTSPTLVTPVLGVATATSVNKVTITAPASSAVLTIPDGVTLTGPASSGTAMTLGNTETVTGVKTFGSAGAVGRFKLAGTTSGTTTVDASATASGTLTLPAATDTLVGKATTDTFTNKTFNSTGTGNVLQVSGVTVSSGQYPGETTTGSATAGNVGEFVTSSVAFGSAVSLTTATAANVTSISLTAGDWDIYGTVHYVTAPTTNITQMDASVSTTSATVNTAADRFSRFNSSAGYLPNGVYSLSAPVSRISIAGTTTVFLVASSTFTVSTNSAYGYIGARRAR